MLDLRPVSRALDEHHQRFVDASVAESLQRVAFQRFDRSGFDHVVIARGRAAWQNRVLQQQAGLVVAARFLGDLVEMGTAADIQGLATRIVRDRGVHLELARRMTIALGGKDAIPGTPVPPPRIDADAPLRVLDVVVGTLCIGESAAMRLLVEMSKQTTAELARDVITRMAADAAIHARLGWTMLSIVLPALTAPEREFLVDRMPDAFERAYTRYVPTTVQPGTRPGAPLHPFGSLDAAFRSSVYDGALRPVVERFERLSLPGQRARDEGHRRRAQRDRARS